MGRRRGRRQTRRSRRGRRGSGMPRTVKTNGTNGVVRMVGSDSYCSGLTGTEQTIVTAGAAAATFDLLFMCPGQTGANIQFPRMNAIAKLYSLYRWVSATIRFKPSCGTTTPGRIIMSATYDPTGDSPPATMRSLLEAIPHTNGLVYRPTTLMVPCGRNNFQLNWYPVQLALTAPASDLSVPFVVNVGTDQGAGGATVGFIEVDWVLEFRNPISSAENPD